MLTTTFLLALSSTPTAALLAQEPQAGVQWFQGPFFSARGKARAEKKLLAVAFVAQWSDWSKKLEKDTFGDPGVVAALEGLVCYRAEATSREGQRVADKFPVRTYPTVFFVGSDGRPEELIEGYIPPQSFIPELARIRAGQGTRSAYERKVAQDPRDIAARLQLAD